MRTIQQYKSKSLLLLFFVITVVTISAVSACNDDQSKASNSDTTAAAATDTTSAKPATKKVRKGKASTMMASTTDQKMKIEKDKEGVYSRTEKMPEYPGGEAALSKYVEDNINYPQDAMDQGDEGTVKVSFVVDEKGKVMNPVVTNKSKSVSLDKEATRIVEQMPAWKPGIVKGKAVKTRMELPITFKLAES